MVKVLTLASLKTSFRKHSTLWILLGILLAGAFFRFYELNTVPPGVHPDEAANGLDIIRMIEHHDFRVLYDTNGPREALFFYMQAPFVLLLGGTSLALRLAPAIIGVATIGALFLLVRIVWGTRAALVSSFLLAVLPWHITLSRDGFRAILTPLVTILVLYFYLRLMRDRKYRDAIWAGILLGLGFYTYLAYRLFPLLLAFMILVGLIWYRNTFKALFKPVLLSFVVAGIVLIPLGIYGVQHPADLVTRAGGVSVFNPHTHNPFGILFDNVGKTALMFNVEGDQNYRHNLGGYPLLDPVSGVLFLVGLVYFISRIKKPAYLMVLAWLGVMLLPEVLTSEGIPHALRAIGAIPPTIIIAGVAGTWVWTRLLQAFPRRESAKRVVYTTVCLLAVLLIYYSYERYFVVWAHSPQTHQAYSQDTADMARYLNSLPVEVKKAAVTDGYSKKTLDYLTWRRASYTWIDPKNAQKYVISRGKNIIVFGLHQRPDLARFEQKYPGGKLSEFKATYNGQADFLIYEVTR